MLDPILEHNRTQFDRLKRQQLVGIPVTVGIALLVILGVLTLGRSLGQTVEMIIVMSPLAGYGIFCIYAEVQKTRLFWRDLRERRNG